MSTTTGQATPFAPTFFHGTRAELAPGDLILPGFHSNYGARKSARFVFCTGTLDAAIWGAELAHGEQRERIYLVEPQGPCEDDPDVTDKRFPGNPTRSYRTRDGLRVVGEVTGWLPHPSAQVATMKAHLEQLKAQGISSLNDDDTA